MMRSSMSVTALASSLPSAASAYRTELLTF
jgi:hypothetical protein